MLGVPTQCAKTTQEQINKSCVGANQEGQEFYSVFCRNVDSVSFLCDLGGRDKKRRLRAGSPTRESAASFFAGSLSTGIIIVRDMNTSDNMIK